MTDKLNKKREILYKAYFEASEDKDREEELKDWNAIDFGSMI